MAKKKKKLSNSSGCVYIHSTANNTILTVTDLQGNAILWGSSGTIGYKGSKKSTPYVAGLVAEKIGKDAMALGLKSIIVKINGIGNGKDMAIRNLKNIGLIITEIHDITPLPHNGCQPAKKPR